MSIANEAEEDRPSVGQALRRARIDAGLTVDEVSTSTRVRVPIVHAIEENDFSRCGGDVYARGHIRTLAQKVGLDAGKLVAQYDAEHGGRPEPTSASTLFEAERIRSEPRQLNWTAAMAAAIVAVVGFVGFTLVNGQHDSGQQVAKKTPSAKPSAGANAHTRAPDLDPGSSDSSTTTDPKPSDSAIAAAPADKVTVRMTAQANTWISAEDHNGRLIHEGVLKKGASTTFTDDKRLDLVLGNAGAVTLYVNGKEIKHVGADGQVQRVSYTRGDPEQG